jgi:CDP-diacylglycerol--serine O-phosphatidyltransferase
MGSLRYLAPNAVTSLSIVCGLMSLVSAYQHQWAVAGYYIIWSVLLDNLDGPVARALKATSEFGAQADSFADFLGFGIAPAFLVYVSLSDIEVLGFADPAGKTLLAAASLSWALANMFRLARFNVLPETKGMLFGVPTTLAAGVLVIWYLFLLKYSPVGSPLDSSEFFDEAHVLGTESFPLRVWSYFPAAMIAGAALMVSNLPMPKLGGIKNKVILFLVLVGVVTGYAFNALRVYPDLMIWMPTGWLIFFLGWGQLSTKAREMQPPKMFQ